VTIFEPKRITAATRFCAVFGHPIRHSASPAMQNAGIEALGLDWRYLACEVKPEELRLALQGAQAMGFLGINLTVPHKLLAMDMMDELDESARTWGAVNTVRFEGRNAEGHWRPLGEFTQDPPATVRSKGFNTDADAVVQAIREDLRIELQGARVLLLGAGGAGQVAARKLATEGVAHLYLVNRTPAKAEAAAQNIRQNFPQTSVYLHYPPEPVDLIVNATSVGLKATDPLPFDEKRFALEKAAAVYDMIYRPAETPLLKRAHAAGCRTANGLSMLLYQGAKALELWSGQPAPVAVMRQALEANVYV
jgi:shikimate dehydrogenase